MTKSFVSFQILVLLATIVIFSWGVADQSVKLVNVFAAQPIAAAQGDSGHWKKTKFGWMDSRQWYRPETVEYERRIELIHPLVFSVVLILTSTGLLIWASEESQWADLMGQDLSK